MIAEHRILLNAGLMVALLGGLRQIEPAALAKIRNEWRQLQEELRVCNERLQKQKQKELERQLLISQTNQKDKLIRDLISGRISFQETAVWFMHLNENNSKPELVYISFRGNSREEKYCRQVIAWVQTHFRLHPESQGAELVQRLHKALPELLARKGWPTSNAPPQHQNRSGN